MKRLRITVGNKSYDVTVEDMTEAESYPTSPGYAQPTPTSAGPVQAPPPSSNEPPKPNLPVDTGAVTSPMAGTIKSILVKQADEVKKGQPLVILEAMKMENQITAPVNGSVKRIDVNEGDSVHEADVLLVLE